MRLVAAFACLFLLYGCSSIGPTGAGTQSPDQTVTSPAVVAEQAALPDVGSDNTAPDATSESLPLGDGTSASAEEQAANNDEFVTQVKAIGDVFDTGDGAILIDGENYCAMLDATYADTPMDAVPMMIESGTDQRLAVQYLCPQYKAAMALAVTGFADGTLTVTSSPSSNPADAQIKPGRYTTIIPAGQDGISNCSWRTDAGTSLVDHGYVAYSATGVTISVKTGQVLTSQGCGDWLPAK